MSGEPSLEDFALAAAKAPGSTVAAASKEDVLLFVQKLRSHQGVENWRQLLVVDGPSMVRKLQGDDAFTIGETSMAVALLQAATKQSACEDAVACKMETAGDRGRSRSRDRLESDSDSDPRRFRRGRSGRKGGKKGDRGKNGDKGWGKGKKGDRGDRGFEKKPPLWAAVESGRFSEVETLLGEGADVNARHKQWTPLMKASEEGYTDIIELLLRSGADLEASNAKGRTALSFAAAPSMGRPTPVLALEMLLEAGAGADSEDLAGNTPLAHAQRECRAEAVRILEKHGR